MSSGNFIATVFCVGIAALAYLKAQLDVLDIDLEMIKSDIEQLKQLQKCHETTISDFEVQQSAADAKIDVLTSICRALIQDNMHPMANMVGSDDLTS
jgi:hypothetical protein